MRDYVTGWRRGGTKAAAPAVTPKATPQATPQSAPKPAAAPAPLATQPAPRVIQVEAAAPAAPRAPRVIRMPSLRVPTVPMEWIAILGFVLIFRISTDATYAAAQQIWTDGSVTWWHCAAAQAVASVVERFMFAGNINSFTLFVLAADALINAWGLVVDLLPNFFASGLWQLLGTPIGLSGYRYDQATTEGLLIALALGAFLAYAGDKLLDIAMERRG